MIDIISKIILTAFYICVQIENYCRSTIRSNLIVIMKTYNDYKYMILDYTVYEHLKDYEIQQHCESNKDVTIS